MSITPRCHLTPKDFNILEAMLERGVLHDEAFLRLLRHKLSTATVILRDDIDPRIATVNSRVDFTVDGRLDDNRILVFGDEGVFPGLTLPITTLRGLALLGLLAGERIVVERSDAATEEIRLDSVSYQPEAAWKDRAAPQTEAPFSVVVLAARRRPAPVNPANEPIDPDDDNPGPRAA